MTCPMGLMDDDLGEVGAVMVERDVKSKSRDWAAA